VIAVLFLLHQNPIIVDVGSQPDATGDISIDFVVGMFAMAVRSCWPQRSAASLWLAWSSCTSAGARRRTRQTARRATRR
jgi:hypothetical protein